MVIIQHRLIPCVLNAFTAYFNRHDHAQICVTRSGLDIVIEQYARCTYTRDFLAMSFVMSF